MVINHSNTDFSPGKLIAGRYEIVELLGSGGMGMVLQVLDRELGNENLALKLLHRHLAEDNTVFRRFLNEVRVARSLTHPNIVRIHDIGRAEEGFSYISMELVQGQSLREKLHSSEGMLALPIVEVGEILLRVLRGIGYAHRKGVVHRDLKPANILLANSGEIKIVDFGTARIQGIETNLTRTGAAIGTPDYMSPEVIRGEDCSKTGDIYALGIMAFEMITGKKPFPANSVVAAAFKHVNEPLPQLDLNQNGLPSWVQDFVEKAAAKDPAQRFQSAEEMAQVLVDNIPNIVPLGDLVFDEDQPTFQGSLEPSQDLSKLTGQMDLSFGVAESFVLDSEDSWSFSSPSHGTAKVSASIRQTARDISSSFMMFSRSIVKLLVLFLVVIGGILLSRVLPSLNLHAEKLVVSLERSSGFELPRFRRLLNLADVRKREELSKVPALPSYDITTETSVASVESAPSKIGSEKEKLANPPNQEEPSRLGGSKPEFALVEDAAIGVKTETHPPARSEAEKAQPAKLVLSQDRVYLSSVSDGEGSSFSLNDLVNTRWNSEISVSNLEDQKQLKKIGQQVKANIFSYASSQVVASVPAEQRQLENAKIGLGGSLKSLSDMDPKAGKYRLDIVHAGEVLGSQEFDLYQEKASYSVRPITKSLGSQKLRVINKPSYFPAIPNKNMNIVEESVVTYPATESSLPPARGTLGAKMVQARPVIVSRPDSRSLELSNPEQTYQGYFVFADKSRKAFQLKLQRHERKITGSALLAGYGQFRVMGRALPRGIELILNGVSGKLRLSGSDRRDSLRGQFNFPGRAIRGSWSARIEAQG